MNGQRLEEPYVPAQFRDQRSMSEVTVPEGGYFVLGDHRNLSSDSRDFGVVEREAIFGKAVFAYWPTDMMGKTALESDRERHNAIGDLWRDRRHRAGVDAAGPGTGPQVRVLVRNPNRMPLVNAEYAAGAGQRAGS